MKLNTTYVNFTASGAKKKARQARADKEAAALGFGGMARAKAKASTLYKNAEWDLVDAAEEAPEALSALAGQADSAKPPEVRGLNEKELSALVRSKKKERKAIQSEIQELSRKREAFLEEQRAAAPARPENLNSAVKKSLRKAAQSKGLEKTE